MKALSVLKLKLLTERNEAKAAKQRLVEGRLSASARSYNGNRNAEGIDLLPGEKEPTYLGSRVHLNITRQITNDGASQLGDLLFPSDDRNYGIKEVPLAPPPVAIENQPAVNRKGEPLTDPEGNRLTNKQAHQQRVELVRVKAKRMFAKLEAAFSVASYAAKGREAIRDAAIYGTGILKGPITTRKAAVWNKRNNGSYGLRPMKGYAPDMKVVSPFDWFPDMSASCVKECGYFWERAYLRPDELQKTPHKLGFDANVVRRALTIGPARYDLDDTARSTASDRAANELQSKGRFIVWERRGYIERSLMLEAGASVSSQDPYIDAIVYFVGDEPAAVIENPSERDDPIYSTFVWDEDPLSIFGYGIPTLMADPQSTYTAIWRMAVDNAGLSAVPQIIFNKGSIKPVGQDDYTLRAGKVWENLGAVYSSEQTVKPIDVIHITQNLQQMFAMMDKAEESAYELTGVTRVEKSQQMNDNAPVTLGATQIQQNNSSVSRRGQARRFDDMITSTLVKRFYDFFMQFEADDDIKANMEIEPRGSTILLAKELQATNLMQFYQITGGGQAEGVKPLPLMRAIAASMQFSEGKFIETEDETQSRKEAEAQQEPQKTPEQANEERKLAIEEAKIELEQFSLNINAEVKAKELQIKEAEAQSRMQIEVAKLTEAQEARLDNKDLEIHKVNASHEFKMAAQQLSEQTKRDIAASKMATDNLREQNANARTSAELAVRQQEANTKDRELDHKQRTGEQGI